jgi:hypothetical protein
MAVDAMGMTPGFLDPAEVRAWNGRARLLRAAGDLRAVAEDTEAKLDPKARWWARQLGEAAETIAAQIGAGLGIVSDEKRTEEPQ